MKQVAKSEVLDFTPNWKSPVMLIYQKRLDLPPFDVDEWKSRLDTSILYRDHFSAGYIKIPIYLLTVLLTPLL